MYENFSDLVMSRQSCRDFNDKKLDKDTIEKIVRLAINAPSACNSQPWQIYIVMDEKAKEDTRKALQDCGMNKFIDKAQAFIVLSEKKSATLKVRISERFSNDHFIKYDIGQLVAYITLTAESLGVKSCILGWVNEENLKKAVGMPADEESNIVIALGYSDIPVREKSRKNFDDIVKEI